MVDGNSITPGKSYASMDEVKAYDQLLELSRRSPIPDNEFLANLGLFYVRVSLARMLFMHKLYLNVLNTHGVIIELGVRWGQNLALLSTFRNIYEPYNQRR